MSFQRAKLALFGALRHRLTFILPFIAYAGLLFVDDGPLRLGGDGFYSWVFARSIALDGDLLFANDYAQCGDRLGVGLEWIAGRPDNPFYVAGALLWTPLLWIARVVASLLGQADWLRAHTCSGAFVRLFMLTGPLSGAFSVHLTSLCATRFVGARSARVATWLWALSIPFLQYAGIDAHYSHIYLTALSTAALWWSLESADGRKMTAPWLFLGAGLAFGIVMTRVTAGTMIAPMLCAAVAAHSGPRALKHALAPALGALVGACCTLAIYTYLYGNAGHVPQGPHFLHPDNAHPWLVLFGVHGGLFFWAPATWLALVGVVIALRSERHRWLHAATLVSFAVSLYVDSIVLDWDASWSFGARRLLPYAPAFALWTAFTLNHFGRALRVHAQTARWLESALVVALLVLGVSGTLSASGAKQVTQADLYGGAIGLGPLWAPLDRRGLDLAILPAEAYFSARYRMPIGAYRQATAPFFRRDYLSLAVSRDTLQFAQGMSCALVAEGHCDPSTGLHGTHVRLVFTTEWDHVDEWQMNGTAAAGTHARLRLRDGFWHTRDCGEALFDVAASRWTVPVALECGRSGVHDYELSFSEPVVVTSLQLRDNRVLTPVGPPGQIQTKRRPSALAP